MLVFSIHMTFLIFCGLTGIYAFLVQLKEKNIIDTYEIEYFIEKIVFLIKNNISKTSIYDTLSGIHSAVIYYYGRYKIDDNAVEDHQPH